MTFALSTAEALAIVLKVIPFSSTLVAGMHEDDRRWCIGKGPQLL